jgi:hypothetical protein
MVDLGPPALFFWLAGLRFRIFSTSVSSSGEKKLEEKKKSGSKLGARPPSSDYPTNPPPIDFDPTDDQCFSEQMCEQ